MQEYNEIYPFYGSQYTSDNTIVKLVDENKDNFDQVIDERTRRSYEKNGKAIALTKYIRS